MLRPRDDEGQELDADFAIERTEDGFTLTVEHRGGGPTSRPRNTQYVLGMYMHLRRMAEHDMVLLDVQVASKPALALPESARSIIQVLKSEGFRLPLQMNSVDDIGKLRLAIGKGSAKFQNTSKSTGNNTKRMCLIVRSPKAVAMSLQDLEDIFTGQASSPIWTAQPTADEKELERRVHEMRHRVRKIGGLHNNLPEGRVKPSKDRVASERFARDPNVITWVLENADGICEVCGRKAPFEREGGDPYLEVHHVRPLSEGGPDKPNNALACCPNCHRELHFGRQRHHFRSDLLQRISRLQDWPERTREK